MVLSLNTMRVRQDGIIIQEINMKRKFKHKKLLKVNIEMIEHEWYSRFNKAYYKQNKITTG